MTELTYLFGVVAVLAGALSSISIWAPRRLVLKLLAVGGTLCSCRLPMPASRAPRPAQAGRSRVVAGQCPGSDRARRQPARRPGDLSLAAAQGRARAARLHPTLDRDLAEQLQAAQREAQESQSQVQMRLPFEASLDAREPKFYAMPQPQMPSKDYAPPPAQITTGRPSTTPEHRAPMGAHRALGHARGPGMPRRRRRPGSA